MNWKEQVEDWDIFFEKNYKGSAANDYLIKFISTEIIEKLLSDIPSQIELPEWSDYQVTHEVDASQIEQQLRDKWL